MSEYRDEIEAKIAGAKPEVLRLALVELIELGVRLGLEAAAEAALEAYVPVIDYRGDDGGAALSNAAKDIRAIQPADVMRRRNNDGE